jgi:hypothetical protein
MQVVVEVHVISYHEMVQEELVVVEKENLLQVEDQEQPIQVVAVEEQ